MHFAYDEEFILEDDVALLRPLQQEDYDHLLPFSLNEPEIWKYSLVQAGGADQLKKYIELAVGARRAGTEYPFIVFDKRVHRYAGSTRFYDIQPHNQTLQLGYTWYGRDFQGNGLNKHCKYLLLNFAFDTLGVERVEFRADNDNARSIRAMQSIGCTIEGVLRSNGNKPDGRRRDSIVLSILRQEWSDHVSQHLKSQLTQYENTDQIRSS